MFLEYNSTMNWYKIANINSSDIWLDHPDTFESQGINWYIEIVPLNNITGVGWTVNSSRIPIEEIFLSGQEKIPLILLEKKSDGTYELADGQHRYEAYRNIFPHLSQIKAAVFSKEF